MPFHFRLIGKDKYVLFSLIQSLNTSFGISIWEPIAEILANSKGYSVKRQVDVVNGKLKRCKEKIKAKRFIYKNMLDFINEYIDELLSGKKNPDKEYEINSLKKHAYGQIYMLKLEM
ncbi:MAG: TdeIII family type II restriction endonuclease [candidate division WOR-3 bacterium]